MLGVGPFSPTANDTILHLHQIIYSLDPPLLRMHCYIYDTRSIPVANPTLVQESTVQQGKRHFLSLFSGWASALPFLVIT